MLTQRTRGLQTTVLVCQALLVTLVFVAVAQVTFRFVLAGTPAGVERYPIYCGLLILGLALEALHRDKAQDVLGRGFLRQHGLSLRQSACAVGVLLVFLAAAKDAFISRTFLAFLVPALYGALLWSNLVLPRLVARRIFRGPRRERLLLVGSRARAERLAGWVRGRQVLGLQVVGRLGEPAAGAEAGLPWLGAAAELERVIAEHRITQVVLLELPEFSESHLQTVRRVESLGARLLILNNLAEKLNHPVVHVEDDGHIFIALRAEPLENPLNRILKRLLDVAVALPVVVFVVPPLALAVWLVQRWQSPGAVFFRQRRAGIQNEEFDIIKFRTMHATNPDAARQAAREDGRVYPLGRWLRRLSLDELPQFLNVLRGEMSVVGPRPHMLEHNTDFARLMGGYHVRSFVKPGITGLAQVRGFRGEVHSVADIRHRLESDISYIEDWRLVLDVAIIFRTALQVVLLAANGLFRKISGAQTEPSPAFSADALRPGAGGPESYSPAYFQRDYRQILGLRFFVGSAAQAVAIGLEGGLVVAPAAPMLLALEEDPAHRAAVLGSDLLLTDSGLLVLLWKLMTGESVTRVSGLEYLQLLLAQPALHAPGATFWVMPNAASMARNLAWLQDEGLPVTEGDCYLAPAYDRAKITDPALLEILRRRRPRHVIMAVGGGVQEKLGADLLRQLGYRPAIHCTGAAIGFLSGDQVGIPRWADRARLGWLFRCLDKPATFIPRYWASRKLLGLMIEYHGRLPAASGPGPVTPHPPQSSAGGPGRG